MSALYAATFFLSMALLWVTINKSGVVPFDWYVSMVFIGIALLIRWSRNRRTTAPPLRPWLRWTIVAVSLYMVFQLLPLPLAIVEFLSPPRAQLARALAPVAGRVSFAPLSVNQSADLLWLLTIFGSLAAFFLVRELAFRFLVRPGLLLAPLLAIATFEALLGLAQVGAGAVQATGTYNGRDHYVGLLELVLPLTITYGMVVFSRRIAPGSIRDGETSIVPALGAVGLWLLATIQLLAILASLSRAGILDTLIALLAVTLLVTLPRLPSAWWRLTGLAGVLVGLVAVLVVASPRALLVRLADTETQSEGRLWIWRESLPLHKEFAWFGTGLMGFDPTFLKYQAILNDKRIDFAHNDYLQYLIELGILGFIPLMAAVGGVLWPIGSGAWLSRRPEKRLLLVGCTASLLALAVHSVFDFNLYVPANLLTFAWVAGYGSVYASPSGQKVL